MLFGTAAPFPAQGTPQGPEGEYLGKLYRRPLGSARTGRWSRPALAAADFRPPIEAAYSNPQRTPGHSGPRPDCTARRRTRTPAPADDFLNLGSWTECCPQGAKPLLSLRGSRQRPSRFPYGAPWSAARPRGRPGPHFRRLSRPYGTGTYVGFWGGQPLPLRVLGAIATGMPTRTRSRPPRRASRPL